MNCILGDGNLSLCCFWHWENTTSHHTSEHHAQALMWSTYGKAIFTTAWASKSTATWVWSGSSAVDKAMHLGRDRCVLLLGITTNSTIHRLCDGPTPILGPTHTLACTTPATLYVRGALCSRNLFAVQPGDTRTEPLPYPISQVASTHLTPPLLRTPSITCSTQRTPRIQAKHSIVSTYVQIWRGLRLPKA